MVAIFTKLLRFAVLKMATAMAFTLVFHSAARCAENVTSELQPPVVEVLKADAGIKATAAA